MSIRSIQTLFLILVALVIPVFFVLLFVTSAYHRLAALRGRCEEILMEARAVTGPAELARVGQAYDQAVAAYDRIRLRFPERWLATLFRFAAPDAWPSSKSRVSCSKREDREMA